MNKIITYLAGATLFAIAACTPRAETTQQVSTTPIAQSPSETDELVLVDLVVMNPGYDIEDREAYEAALLPIVQRYNIKRISSYDIVQHLGGKAEDAIRLNLWSIPNSEVIQVLGQDADYQALENMRNELHDFSQLTLYTAETVEQDLSSNAPLYLVDFAVMNDGYDLEDRRGYVADIRPIAQKYGAEVTQSYEMVNYLGGTVEDVIKLDIWTLPGPEAVQQLNEDPEYQAIIPYRNEIHDFDALTLYFAKSTN
ncbi:DUF1330 domain-containing protein [Leptothoe spongobia]|uniref:DUF1330 domain-containing protein n=1 Tax=Leptothoe spongobia TAU-MAC 1115 TaxID=1967444 RepID=A0A947DIF3_9CYAN|nr:DUF1330 domain-containing protein [Leptothoe spongobia]MBT9317812.1 DUF1330 domain-containing protein [Leptothoe spongobia TAU-MAC 1115]